ncbi:MAG: DUF4270 family protein [Marinoscillum sp.]|jgi:hypothetical protein
MKLKEWCVCGLLVMTFQSCVESSTLGEDFLGDDSFEISYSDTIALQLKTLRYDSLPTSTSDRLLLADMSDAVFNSVSTAAYFLMGLPEGDIGEAEVFDSLTFYLPQDGYALGIDEIQTVTLKLERLHTELDYPESGIYYNFSSPTAVNGGSTVLFEQQVKFYVDRENNVTFRLPDELGEQLFDAIRDDSDILESTSEFHQYLKGFRLSIDVNDESVAIGLVADSIRMRIHTTNYEPVPPVPETNDFYVNGSPYFTRYEYDVPEELSTIQSYKDAVSSELTSHASVIYGGMGYAVEVAMPSVANIKLDGERNYVVTGANLKLYPVQSNADLPTELTVNYMDEDHVVLSTDAAFSAHLVLDEDHGRDTYYSVDVTGLIEYLMASTSIKTYSLIITLPGDPGSNSLTSLWLGDESFSSELILYTISNK